MNADKRFLVKDHSGRGFAVTLPLSDIRERWDMSYSNSPDDEFEDNLGDWLDSAEIGDSFFNNDDYVSFTRVD
jgi:hypothetical protein